MLDLRHAAACSAAVLLTLLVAGAAFAAPPSPSPYDGGPPAQAPISLPILQTALFPLGTSLTSFGVAASELAGVGPQAASSTSSGTLIVDDDRGDCPNAQFTTIQGAVTAAPPGAKIKVCAGVYVEQVTIPAGKDGLTLYSVPDLAAVIKAPPVIVSTPRSIVTITGAHDVTLRHFTITGPGGGPCDSLEYGVRIGEGGSALITDNHITQIRDTPFSGCQNGVGVLVGRNSQNTFGIATVVHNLIDDYQKGGVVIDGTTDPMVADSNAEVAYNEIDGAGPTAVIAQNGIQVSRDATANVHHNVVAHNIYSPATTTGEGILTFQVDSPQLTVHHNNVYDNTDGIGLYTTANAEIGWNDSHDNVAYDGLFADTDATNNLIEHNKLRDNAEFDCDDVSTGPYNAPALVANRWVQDLGLTENRPGLCKHATP